MSSLKINDNGAYERDIEQNWAAAYAKRLVEQESDDRDSAIAAAIEEEEGKRVSSDNAIRNGTALQDGCVRTRHIYPGDVTTGCIHALAVNEDKLANGAVTKDKLAPESVYSSNIKNNAVMRGHLSSSATLRLNSSSNGNFTIEYCDGAPIDAIQYGTVSFIASIDNIPLRDSAAQEWISNNCVIRSGDPPASANDADFVPHDGLLYLQLDLTTITNIFVLCGGTPLGNLYWKQIYPTVIADGAVTESKLSSGVRTKLDYTDALGGFHSHPVKIGLWADGTPVWRYTFAHTLTTAEMTDEEYYPLDEVLKEPHPTVRGFILNAFATLNWAEDPFYVDSCGTEFDGLRFKWSFIPPGGTVAIYGFVEFATPETNIISV